MEIVTGAPQLRPAAGWFRRRLVEFASDAGATLRRDRGRPADLPAVPPRRLRARVGAPRAREYVDGGRLAATELERALAPHGFTGISAVLDFGAGSGRVITHLTGQGANGPRRLVGVDVDAQAIAWARSHLSGITFAHSHARPPLPFADAEFSLVYSISVFSHLDEPAQDAWLAELARILAPGGSALLSTHGPGAYAAFRSGAVRTTWCDPDVFVAHGPLADGEMLAVPYRQSRWSRGDLPGVGEGYGLSFHGPEYIAERWSRFLDVEAILPQAVSGWQDLVVLRKPR